MTAREPTDDAPYEGWLDCALWRLKLKTVLRLIPNLLATSVALPLNGSESTYRFARPRTARWPRTRASSMRLASFPSPTKFFPRTRTCRRTQSPSESNVYFRPKCLTKSSTTDPGDRCQGKVHETRGLALPHHPIPPLERTVETGGPRLPTEGAKCRIKSKQRLRSLRAECPRAEN